MADQKNPNRKLIAENRRARYDYAIEDDLEAGIILMGSEVSRCGSGSRTSRKATRPSRAGSCG
jgi:SsrA-binding protein